MQKREFLHSVVCFVRSENYVLENGALCPEKTAMTVAIQCRSQWKLGLTAFVEASEALSSVCCGVEGGKENRINGMCPQCLLSLSTYMVMPPWVNCCARNDLWKTEISSVGAAEHPMLDEREVLEVTVTTAESHKARWKWTGCAGSYYFVCVMKHRGWWMQ